MLLNSDRMRPPILMPATLSESAQREVAALQQGYRSQITRLMPGGPFGDRVKRYGDSRKLGLLVPGGGICWHPPTLARLLRMFFPSQYRLRFPSHSNRVARELDYCSRDGE